MTTETKTAIQQAAAELRGIAADIRECHTVDGDWGTELQARAEHDHLLFLADVIEREEKARDGLVLVPLIPTDEMIEVTFFPSDDPSARKRQWNSRICMYRRMLDVAARSRNSS